MTFPMGGGVSICEAEKPCVPLDEEGGGRALPPPLPSPNERPPKPAQWNSATITEAG